jgi:hypothetical protein
MLHFISIFLLFSYASQSCFQYSFVLVAGNPTITPKTTTFDPVVLHLQPTTSMHVYAPQHDVPIIGDAMHVTVQIDLSPESQYYSGARVPCYVFTCSTATEMNCLMPAANQNSISTSVFYEVVELKIEPTTFQCTVDIFLISVSAISNRNGMNTVNNLDANTYAANFVTALRSKEDNEEFSSTLLSQLNTVYIQASNSKQIIQRMVNIQPPLFCNSETPSKEFKIPRLFYMFSFNNEYRLLQLLLEELPADVVDMLVLIEANMTHSGKPKPLHFNRLKRNSIFRKLENRARILHVKILDMDNTTMTDVTREQYQRNEGVRRALHILDAKPNDLVVVTDVDGLVRGNVLRTIKNCAHITTRRPYAFWLRHHVYSLNWQVAEQKGMWGAMEGPRLVRACILLGSCTPSQVVEGGGGGEEEQFTVALSATTIFRSPAMAAPTISFNIIYDAGWHLSWFGQNADSMVEKMGDSMDQELNIFRNAGHLGISLEYVTGIMRRMKESGGTLWGSKLERVARPNIPKAVEIALAVNAVLSSFDKETGGKGTLHNDNDDDQWNFADPLYWFSTESSYSAFELEQDQLWVNKLLDIGSVSYCYTGVECDSSKSINVEYICGTSVQLYNASIEKACTKHSLDMKACETIKKTLKDSCLNSRTRHLESGEQQQQQQHYMSQEVYFSSMDKFKQIRVDVDGKPFLFNFAKETAATHSVEFCNNVGLNEKDCSTLLETAMKMFDDEDVSNK